MSKSDRYWELLRTCWIAYLCFLIHFSYGGDWGWLVGAVLWLLIGIGQWWDIRQMPSKHHWTVEFWWGLEQQSVRFMLWRIRKTDDDPPRWAQTISIFFYRRRKAAEKKHPNEVA